MPLHIGTVVSTFACVCDGCHVWGRLRSPFRLVLLLVVSDSKTHIRDIHVVGVVQLTLLLGEISDYYGKGFFVFIPHNCHSHSRMHCI